MNNYYLAGNRGLVGTNYAKFLETSVGGNKDTCDYTNFTSCAADMMQYKIDTVILNAATVGGLQDDINNAFSIYITNLTIQNNIFKLSNLLGIKSLLFQSSACAYPDNNEEALSEDMLLSAAPNSIYLPTALPKITGMHQCIAHNKQYGTSWKTAICSNMYGPYDRTGEKAHVIGSLMRKFVQAVKYGYKEIEIWGNGSQARDFIYIYDAIAAMEAVLSNDTYDVVNVASGESTSIRDIVALLTTISGYKGVIVYNTDKPTGSKSKTIDNSRLLSLGWKPSTKLVDGLTITYKWYYDNI